MLQFCLKLAVRHHGDPEPMHGEVGSGPMAANTTQQSHSLLPVTTPNLCPVLGTFQSAFWYTRPPASQRSNKKQTLFAPFFSPGNRRLSRQKQWSQGHKTRKEKHSSDSVSGPLSTTTQMLLVPLPREGRASRPIFPPSPLDPLTFSPPQRPTLRPQQARTAQSPPCSLGS